VRRIFLLMLAVAVLTLAVAAGAGAQTGPGTSTTTLPASQQEGGTSPWVLVLIGAAAGAVVGVFTGLARRRRAQQGRPPGRD
jgi:hypothetical protein